MTSPCKMTEDVRPIRSVLMPGQMISYTAGHDGIDSICAYSENGEMAPVPWLAFYRDGQVVLRIPAHSVMHIEYAVPLT